MSVAHFGKTWINVPKHPTSVSESCQDFNLSNLHFREFLGINFGHFEAGRKKSLDPPMEGRETCLAVLRVS